MPIAVLEIHSPRAGLSGKPLERTEAVLDEWANVRRVVCRREMERTTILLGESTFSDSARRLLAQRGDVIDFESLEHFRRHLPEADAVVLGLEIGLPKPMLDQASRLRVIACRTSQLLHIDMQEVRRRGIDVLSNEPDAPAIRDTTSTAELAMALVLALARRLPWAFESLKQEHWERSRFGGTELQGKTLGLIGFGRLGRRMATYGRALGMRVIASDPQVSHVVMADFDAEAVSLEDLLRRADIVSVHASMQRNDRPLLGSKQFRLLKPSALLINTARGELVDEQELLIALEEGRLAAAAIDTLAGEQPDGSHLRGNPLVAYAKRCDNLLLVPHLGGATLEATERTQLYISERLVEYLATPV